MPRQLRKLQAFPEMPRQLKKCKFFLNAHNSDRVGIGGQGVEPPVRGNLGLASVVGGIKVRLGEVSLI